MRFSPSTGTCYPETLDYPTLPDDVVSFDDTIWQEYCTTPGAKLAVQSGKVIVVAPAGAD